MNIKLFEEYSELYTEVDRNIFWDNYENVVTITDKEISKVKELIPKCIFSRLNPSAGPTHNDIIHIQWVESSKKKPLLQKGDFYFYKNDDDWWWIYIDTGRVLKYYKCDQLEGFLKLLTDLIVKPKIGLW